MRVALLTALLLLGLPAGAAAGGFATVGLSSLPDDTRAGEPWPVELTVLAHGRSEAPVDGLHPAVIVMRGDGAERRRFAARPTGRPGVYRARVVFGSPGVWEYAVVDGYAGQTHRFPPVRIGDGPRAAAPAPTDSGGGPNLGLALLAAAVAGLVAGIATRRLQRPAPA
jgi:hypothetical protein